MTKPRTILITGATDGLGAPWRSGSPLTGRFFDRTREARANAQAYDPAARAELWRRSLKLVDHPDEL